MRSHFVPRILALHCRHLGPASCQTQRGRGGPWGRYFSYCFNILPCQSFSNAHYSWSMTLIW